jgi:hypothetical protein
MSSSALKTIEKLQAQLDKLKLSLTNSETKSAKPKTERKRKDKPASIEECKKKAELAKFTVKELKDWVKEKKIDTKKLAEKKKDDLVKLVWKNLKSGAESEESESSESESSDSDSESESDSE